MARASHPQRILLDRTRAARLDSAACTSSVPPSAEIDDFLKRLCDDYNRAGVDPVEQYRKYPHRSPTLHAKENGRNDDPSFDAVLGRPGVSKGVDWDVVLAAAAADGVEWLVVECEKHCDGLSAAAGSIEFLRSRLP